MTLSELQQQLFSRLNFGAAPGPQVETRLRDFLNDAQQDLLSDPDLSRIRDGATTFASVIGQAQYGLAPQIGRITTITERTSQRRLGLLSLDWLRQADPGLTATGTPEQYVLFGVQPVTQQPASTGLWIVSASASDTAAKVQVEGVRSGGYLDTPAGTTLNGTTRAQIGTLTDYVAVTKVVLDSSCTGAISLYDAAAAGNELARIIPGRTSVQYLLIQLYPTPTAVVTYYVDFQRKTTALKEPSDVPILPEEFHHLLIDGARMREYEKQDDTRYSVAQQQFEEGRKKLRYYVLNSPDYRPVPGVMPFSVSNLGGNYPSGVW